MILLSAVVIWFLQAFGVTSAGFGMVEDNNDSLLAVIGSAVLFLFRPLGFETWQPVVATVMGLVAKSMVVDNVIENMNLCKCFNIVCEHPQPICNFIIHELNRSATTFEARGAYSDAHKTVIMTTMRRSQAIRLRNFIRQQEPTAFIMIENSSEIIGKGFSPV